MGQTLDVPLLLRLGDALRRSPRGSWATQDIVRVADSFVRLQLHEIDVLMDLELLERLKEELFGATDPVGRTVHLRDLPFTVIGVRRAGATVRVEMDLRGGGELRDAVSGTTADWTLRRAQGLPIAGRLRE